MNHFIFLFGVFMGNIFDIKYIIIIQIIYLIIKNDPIGEIYPRTLLTQAIIWMMSKNKLYEKYTSDNTINNSDANTGVTIEDITEEKINRFTPSPKLLKFLSNT